jgi:hypothetical protein
MNEGRFIGLACGRGRALPRAPSPHIVGRSHPSETALEFEIVPRASLGARERCEFQKPLTGAPGWLLTLYPLLSGTKLCRVVNSKNI